VHTSPNITKEQVRESPSPGRSWWSRLMRQRSVQLAALGWVVANLVVLVTAKEVLPFAWPALADRSVLEHLLDRRADSRFCAAPIVRLAPFRAPPCRNHLRHRRPRWRG
jgi:hypothetical protein